MVNIKYNPNHLQFQKDFFEDEVQCGFFVPAIIKQLWGTGLEVLAEIDRVCKKNDIRYFADWGTLLGAVRHEGFVPWDDDIDISMMRSDYEKFQRVAKTDFADGFEFYNYVNRDNHWMFLGRVINKNRICFEEEHLDRFHQFPYIVSVDIFVMDYVTDDERKDQAQRDDFKFVYALSTMVDQGESGEATIYKMLPEVERRTGQKVDPGLHGISLKRRLFEIAEGVLKRFGPEDGTQISQLFTRGIRNKNYRWPVELYQTSMDLPFACTTIPVPMCYDERLRMKYGDYMHLFKGGGAHDYPYFKEQQEKVTAVLDFEVPHYTFEKSQLRGNAYNAGVLPQDEKADADFATSDFNVLSETYGDTYKGLVCQSIDGLATLQEQYLKEPDDNLLAESQQLAVDLGTLIESVRGEGTETVSLLEGFCETLYLVSLGEADAAHLGAQLQQIETMAREELLSTKEVLFVITKPSHVRSMQMLYQKERQEEKTIVTVLPVPYYDRKYDGSLHAEHYDLDGYPNEFAPADFQAYDLELHHPDVIYFDNPHDEWHASTSVHPNFYSAKLQASCGKLIYVQPFLTDDFTRADEREYYNAQYFVTRPGVARADRVYVPSEAMREIYIEKWCDFAGEETRHIWEEKVVAEPSLYEECVDEKEKTAHKTIVVGIHASFLQETGEKGLQKLREMLQTFENQSERPHVIFCPHPMLPQANEMYGDPLQKAYKAFLASYQGQDWMELRAHVWGDEEQIRRTVSEADAYYGSGGRLALEFAQATKPVMLMEKV